MTVFEALNETSIRALALINAGDLDAARSELRKGREAARALQEALGRTEAQFQATEDRIDKLLKPEGKARHETAVV